MGPGNSRVQGYRTSPWVRVAPNPLTGRGPHVIRTAVAAAGPTLKGTSTDVAEPFRAWEIRGAWAPFRREDVPVISGSLGIYEIADAAGSLLYAGYAGGRTLHGLRGCIAACFSGELPFAAALATAASYRYEVNSSYLGRWLEILGRYREEHGALPPGNMAEGADLPTLPRFTGGLGRAAS